MQASGDSAEAAPCDASRACVTCGGLARLGRHKCNRCARACAPKVSRKDKLDIGLRVPKRPSNLQDTGLRIDEENNELVLPNGERMPVPKDFSMRYFFESMGHGWLRVLGVVARSRADVLVSGNA